MSGTSWIDRGRVNQRSVGRESAKHDYLAKSKARSAGICHAYLFVNVNFNSAQVKSEAVVLPTSGLNNSLGQERNGKIWQFRTTRR